MVRLRGELVLSLFTALGLAAPTEQAPTQISLQQTSVGPAGVGPVNPRKLRGRFLHITDLHPDPFYRAGSNPDGEHPCHRGKGGSAAGYFGAPTTDCDTPLTLLNATFTWMEENIKDEIDFVIWTGDSARHDNDEDIPRSDTQVTDLNRLAVQKFVEVFGKPDNVKDPDPTNDFVVPIVPTFGNNDMLPHNIFEPGPNKWTRKYSDIWSRFIPEAQIHSFAKGGWFWTEVVPNKLAVISLNTMYFFDSNSAVDGCDLQGEPGYEHMEWLRIQLQFMRERQMKAFLIGHVPPARTESKRSWDETCYQKYTLWQRQYRDVIAGNFFGHMNIDHFMFQDVRDLTYKFKIDGIDTEGLRPELLSLDSTLNDSLSITGKASYLNELRTSWAHLPTPPKGMSYDSVVEATSHKKKKRKERQQFLEEIGGPWGERFSMSMVSPSVVPNYFPTLRIIEYNTTGLEHDHPAMGLPQGYPATEDDLHLKQTEDHDDYDTVDDHDARHDPFDIEKKKKKKKKGRKHKPDFPVPAPPSKSAPPGPAHSPQPFSLISWTQLYANLTEIHEEMHAKQIDTSEQDVEAVRKKAKAHFRYKTEYVTNHGHHYKLADLSVRSWLDLAERIGRSEYMKSPDEVSDKGDSPEPDSMPELVQDSELRDSKKKKKKKHKKKKKSGSKFKDNRLWHEFIKRVFVNTRDDRDLEHDFD